MKKPITIVSTICSLIFLAAVIIFAVGIYTDKKAGTIKADARYEALLNATKENFINHSYGSSDFSINFIQAIGNIEDFSSLKLEINGTLVYSYPPTFFSIPSPELIKSYSDTVNVSGKNFTLRASIYLMTPGSIYNHSRLAFIMILVGTLVVGIYIFFTSGSLNDSDYSSNHFNTKKAKLTNNKPVVEKIEIEEEPKPSKKQAIFNPEPEKTEETSKPIFNPEPESNENTSEEQDKAPVSISFPETTPVFTEEDEQEWNNEELFDNPQEADDEQDIEDNSTEGLDIIDQLEQENLALSDEDFFADSTDNSASKEQEPTEIEEHAFTDDNAPEESSSQEEKQQEQISPITQISLQSSLEEKLDNFILENPNATLSLIKVNGLDRGNAISENIISILKESTDNAQLFEYKSDSYATILTTDLQATVDKFEEIYNKISDFLKSNNATNEVSVGISSASNRKITAERIILEASQALDYASQDPDSPIVAFRANPEKYKEFVESKES